MIRYDDGVETYGPKLVENIVQAIARDCLREALSERAVAHVHDEIVLEAPREEAAAVLDETLAAMARPLPWAPGLRLSADGYICGFYCKK